MFLTEKNCERKSGGVMMTHNYYAEQVMIKFLGSLNEKIR